MKTTLGQRRQLDQILAQDMATLEKAGYHPNAELLTRRLWPVWGKELGISGGSMLGLVNRQLRSLKVEGWVSDKIYPKLPGSRVSAWGLTDAGLASFGLRRGVPQQPPPPPAAGSHQTAGGGATGSNRAGSRHGATGDGFSARPDTRPEVPRPVYEASVLLGVSPLAAPEQVEEAYRRWAKTLHPDRNPNPGDSTEQLKRVNGARDLLLQYSRSRQRR
jgi:hypothetical protein